MRIMIEQKDEYITHLYLVKKDGSLRFVSCIEQKEINALMHYSSSVTCEEEGHDLIGIYTTDIRDGLKMWIASIHKDELKDFEGGEKMNPAYDTIIDGIAYKEIVLADGETAMLKPVGIVMNDNTIKLVDDL